MALPEGVQSLTIIWIHLDTLPLRDRETEGRTDRRTSVSCVMLLRLLLLRPSAHWAASVFHVPLSSAVVWTFTHVRFIFQSLLGIAPMFSFLYLLASTGRYHMTSRSSKERSKYHTRDQIALQSCNRRCHVSVIRKQFTFCWYFCINI